MLRPTGLASSATTFTSSRCRARSSNSPPARVGTPTSSTAPSCAPSSIACCSDATINGAGGTAREISRARRTKIEVQELDRLAFDLCGDETPSSNKACPLGGSGSLGSAAGSMGNEEPAAGGLFGQEITASLASLRLELNLSVFALPSSQAL